MRTRFMVMVMAINFWVGLSGQTPILTFSADQDKFSTLGTADGEIQSSGAVGAGSSAVVYHAIFGATTVRNPPVEGLDTPEFFGGYMLHTMNDSGADYLPNFVRMAVSPASGRGHVTLPVTLILSSTTSGTITNTVFGTFITPTAIEAEGEFRVYIQENTLDTPSFTGASTMFRGAAFDGSKWLVTAEAAVVPTSGVDHARVSTRDGWRELNTEDFSYGAENVNPAGAFTMSGVWFMASKTDVQVNAGFAFAFSDAFFTTRGTLTRHTADVDDSGTLNLSELLRVIELYNTRLGSARTGRYSPLESAEDGFTPDTSLDEGKMALYAAYHAADSDRSGSISLSELLRVIELYNVRSGSTRTGHYSLAANTDDGFAPGE